jgi:hypothetical protein
LLKPWLNLYFLISEGEAQIHLIFQMKPQMDTEHYPQAQVNSKMEELFNQYVGYGAIGFG